MSETDAITAAKSGDPEAFTVLYRLHCPMVRNLCRRAVGPEEYEDLTQDIFLLLHRKIGQFKGESQFKTWLFTMTLNKIREYMRKSKSRPLVSDFFTVGSPQFDVAMKYDLARESQVRIEMERLGADAGLMELRAEGHSLKDISAASGMSLQATRKRVCDSQKRLKAALQ